MVNCQEANGIQECQFRFNVQFSGRPYIDVRLSFNSFLPKNLGNNISKKIVNHWCKKLIKNPYLHDKVEFEIADSCYDFSLKKKNIKSYHFLRKNEKLEYFNIVKNHTHKIIDNYEKIFWDILMI